MKHPPFQSLNEALFFFKGQGFDTVFHLKGDTLHDPKSKTHHPLSKAEILNVLKFEDDSDPDEISILFLVETASGVKGHFVDASGMYASLDFSSFRAC
ncbi:MAG: hypothetical protein H6573_31225 [Lewinellaceae bacterium]|nr:hypothetical protein [Lewinellaceae bacterium]